MEGKGGPITGLVNMKCEDLLKVGCPEVTLLVKTRVRKVYNYVIKNLTITLSDSFGNLIQGGKYIDTVDSTTNTLSTTDTITSTTVYNDSLTYIRHPYYRLFQLTYMFKVGCYETEIDKKIFY